MHPDLLTETIRLLKIDRGNWRKTAEETGLGREWIAKLAHGAIGDPGVVKIQKLHAYLSDKYQSAA